MITPFNRRLALLAAVELALAAFVLSAAFLIVVSAHQPSFQGHTPSAVVAHLTFALSLLLPGGHPRGTLV